MKIKAYLLNLTPNELLGWLFIVFAVLSLAENLTNSIGWMILAKLCWVHSDVIKQRQEKPDASTS